MSVAATVAADGCGEVADIGIELLSAVVFDAPEPSDLSNEQLPVTGTIMAATMAAKTMRRR
jgi:hypothetical protein